MLHLGPHILLRNTLREGGIYTIDEYRVIKHILEFNLDFNPDMSTSYQVHLEKRKER